VEVRQSCVPAAAPDSQNQRFVPSVFQKQVSSMTQGRVASSSFHNLRFASAGAPVCFNTITFLSVHYEFELVKSRFRVGRMQTSHFHVSVVVSFSFFERLKHEMFIVHGFVVISGFHNFACQNARLVYGRLNVAPNFKHLISFVLVLKGRKLHSRHDGVHIFESGPFTYANHSFWFQGRDSAKTALSF
jgi:hypothetical protein